MPLIGRAWKANVNVWKRHLILPSVFNRDECMMHVNKNADDYVVDQNVDRILKEIAYIPLGERIRSKHSSCSFFLFFFPFFSLLFSFLNKYKTCLPVVTTKWGSWILDMLPRGSMDLNFWTCFPEVYGFEIWTCFPEVRWICANVYRSFTLVFTKKIFSISNRVIHWRKFDIPCQCP